EDENGLEKGIGGKKLSNEQRKVLKEETFYGFDIDHTMVRIGMMNLMMHGITKPNIRHLDTLSNEYERFEINNNSNGKVPENYKYILANPP
ncbi:N-6 DNA methylase, partial [Acinetobacter baumannii]